MSAATGGRPSAGGAPPGDIDEFRLVRAIGHGGMGAVFLAHDTILDRLVAIKLIRARVVDAASRMRFLNEARAIARLTHPNVVTIYRAATTRDGQPYIAQALVGGRSLDKVAVPLDGRRALEVSLGVARGLAAAHRRGILHRDVKASNVMLDDDGTPVLLDFGLAKLSEPAAVAARPESDAREAAIDGAAVTATGPAPTAMTVAMPAPPLHVAVSALLPEASTLGQSDATADAIRTASGAVLGTPRYLAPELWAGAGATVRSDLYSLGVLMFELVTGAAPFPHATRDALERAVLGGAVPPPVAERAPGASPELAALVDQCLAREPTERPESADEVVHRLERILLGAPPLPAGDPYLGLSPFSAEHRAVFFGRGADAAAVVDRLRAASFVAVAGDSGIGKSSLCRAAVIPAIEGGALEDGRRWRGQTVRLSRRSAAALRAELGIAGPDQPPDGVGEGRGLLVLFDPIEELVTAADPEEAAEVARLIADLAQVPGVKVLATVRGDFLTRVASLPDLGPLVTASLHLLRALGPADLREAIVEPARLKGVRFESDDTVDALAAAAAGRPGALPLLQFALAELWARRDAARGLIEARALDEIGGAAGALARHADAVIVKLGIEERAAARRILLALVTRDGTAAARSRDELCPPGDARAAAALEALIGGRLLAARDDAGGPPLHAIAHESLLSSWGTLRAWLDDAAGQRALRTRLAAAADEWERLGRRSDLLWTRAQLAESSGLDDLAARDRRFLAASRRAAVRRRVLRAGALAAIPLAAVATWAGVRLHEERARSQRVDGHLDAAAGHERDAAQHSRAAATARDGALDLFDRDQRDPAERAWQQARAATARARAAWVAAAGELEAAVLIDAERADVRARMARVLYDHALVAEREGDAAAVADLTARLSAHDDGSLISAWNRPSHLLVRVTGATRIDVRRITATGGALNAGPIAARGADTVEARLPAGSYQVWVRASDGLEVAAPVLLERGERLALDLALPRADQVPAGFAYVPPGRFLVGSARDDDFRRDFLFAAPLHSVETGGYLVARHEVTLADWMEYLRALPPAERERRRPQTQPGKVMVLRLDGDGPFHLTLQPSTVPYRAAEGEPIVYPERASRREVEWERLPVSGVSFADAQAYAAWLDASGRVPGARLCRELEWERAARGADGRSFAHGEEVAADDANLDLTYGRRPLAYGPDVVGAHPRSNSPFGAADMTGNVWEWAVGPGGAAMLRGGGWYHGPTSALVSNRDFADPTMRQLWAGLRICADIN